MKTGRTSLFLSTEGVVVESRINQRGSRRAGLHSPPSEGISFFLFLLPIEIWKWNACMKTSTTAKSYPQQQREGESRPACIPMVLEVLLATVH
jgi:hypothetical protein